MIQHIEDTMCDESLPVNTIAMCNRLIEILSDNDTNNTESLRAKNSDGFERFRKCVWLINSQLFGQLAIIDMTEEWSRLCQ